MWDLSHSLYPIELTLSRRSPALTWMPAGPHGMKLTSFRSLIRCRALCTYIEVIGWVLVGGVGFLIEITHRLYPIVVAMIPSCPLFLPQDIIIKNHNEDQQTTWMLPLLDHYGIRLEPMGHDSAPTKHEGVLSPIPYPHLSRVDFSLDDIEYGDVAPFSRWSWYHNILRLSQPSHYIQYRRFTNSARL